MQHFQTSSASKSYQLIENREAPTKFVRPMNTSSLLVFSRTGDQTTLVILRDWTAQGASSCCSAKVGHPKAPLLAPGFFPVTATAGRGKSHVPLSPIPSQREWQTGRRSDFVLSFHGFILSVIAYVH